VKKSIKTAKNEVCFFAVIPHEAGVFYNKFKDPVAA
jgi:hypothetical protein